MDALVEATARILTRDGYERASTNRIARLAGVSIGSLYQYFPSKEALVAAVIDRHTAQLARLARATLLGVAMQPVEAAAREIVRVAIEAHRIDPALHRVLAEQTPRLGRQDNAHLLDREAYGLVRAYLDAHRAELAVDDLELAAFVVVTMVESLTHQAVIHRPELIDGERAGRFVDEVAGMVVGYLKAASTGAPSGPSSRMEPGPRPAA